MLISLVGDVGSGKTLFSTYLAYKTKKPVYANYTIDIPRYNNLNPETLMQINEPSLVIIDEAYSWIESRLSGRDINLYLSYVLFQSRKRGLDFILTDQLEGTIDLRFRQMTNFEIHCEYIGKGFQYSIYKLSRYRRPQLKKKIMPHRVAEKIFSIYDSWELISPIDDNLLFKVSKDKSFASKDTDIIVAALLKMAPPEKITKPVISHYCLKHNYPKNYVELVYNAIRACEVLHEDIEEIEKISDQLENEEIN